MLSLIAAAFILLEPGFHLVTVSGVARTVYVDAPTLVPDSMIVHIAHVPVPKPIPPKGEKPPKVGDSPLDLFVTGQQQPSFDCGQLPDPSGIFDGISPACPEKPGYTTWVDEACMDAQRTAAEDAQQNVVDKLCTDMTNAYDKFNATSNYAGENYDGAIINCNNAWDSQTPEWYECQQAAYDAWYKITTDATLELGVDLDAAFASYQTSSDSVMDTFLDSALECCRYTKLDETHPD